MPIMNLMPSFAENLKRLMKERGISTRVLSEATRIPSSTLSEWTAGREPKLGEPAVRLAKFFGVSLEFLVTGQDPDINAVQEVISRLEEDFTTIHQGIYRIKIEKQQGQKKGKGET